MCCAERISNERPNLYQQPAQLGVGTDLFSHEECSPPSKLFVRIKSYSVTYYKPANSPQLLAKNLSIEDDRRSDMSLSDFLARAWTLANEKARSLG